MAFAVWVASGVILQLPLAALSIFTLMFPTLLRFWSIIVSCFAIGLLTVFFFFQYNKYLIRLIKIAIVCFVWAMLLVSVIGFFTAKTSWQPYLILANFKEGQNATHSAVSRYVPMPFNCFAKEWIFEPELPKEIDLTIPMISYHNVSLNCNQFWDVKLSCSPIVFEVKDEKTTIRSHQLSDGETVEYSELIQSFRINNLRYSAALLWGIVILIFCSSAISKLLKLYKKAKIKKDD